MVVKENEGYRCIICDKVISNYNAAKKHERTCGHTKLNRFVDGVEDLPDSGDIPENEQGSNRQVKIGETPVGSCKNCGKTILRSEQLDGDDFPCDTQLYECGNCENIVALENNITV